MRGCLTHPFICVAIIIAQLCRNKLQNLLRVMLGVDPERAQHGSYEPDPYILTQVMNLLGPLT